MELLRVVVLALLCAVALAGGDATSSRSAEEYWRSIWPHTSMPKNLKYMLESGVNDAETKDTQYPHTSFFEDDLHAGKEMNIKFTILHSSEEQKRNTMNDEGLEKSARWGIGSQKRHTMDGEALEKSARWGIGSQKRNTIDDESLEKSARWGIGSLKRNTMDDEALEKSALWGIGSHKRNTMDDEALEKSARWGIGQQKRNKKIAGPENLTLKAICNVNDKFVGEKSKFCAKSMESLLGFVISKLGKDIEALSSSFAPHQTQYTILEGVQRASSVGVVCHKLEYYKPVFYCHQVNATIPYIVPMKAADGTRTNIVGLCHHDTRAKIFHEIFHEHNVMPGTPICHFLGSRSIAWVPRNKELRAAY